MRLEEQAQIQKWLLQHSACAQQKCDEQPPETAVAVEERVNGLELHMHEACFDKNGDLRRFGMYELFQIRHQVENLIGRRWNIDRIAGPCSADPVLRTPEFARLLVRATTPGKQNVVNLSNET